MPKVGWGLREGDQIVPGRTVLRRLGGGKRFEVYLALDHALMATVVVKLVRPDQADDGKALRALRNEARVLARLAHPIVVRSFAAELDGPRPHLVLEHLEGPTVQGLLERVRRLPDEQLVPLALQLASALHYLSGAGFVHLDLKPSNVVMSIMPRLVDFSVARSLEKAGRLSRPVGTRAYMSPEQCDPVALGPVGPPADVWGLGMILYEAATGARPFPKENGGRYPQLGHVDAPLPRDVSPILADAIRGCLQRDPAVRPTPASVAEVLEPLVAALPGRPVLRKRRPGLG